MVDMRMGNQQNIDGIRCKGKQLVVDLIPSLLQTAVHQDALSVYFQTMATAGDTLICAVKTQLHKTSSFSGHGCKTLFLQFYCTTHPRKAQSVPSEHFEDL
jgi:hypothetical protein